PSFGRLELPLRRKDGALVDTGHFRLDGSPLRGLLRRVHRQKLLVLHSLDCPPVVGTSWVSRSVVTGQLRFVQCLRALRLTYRRTHMGRSDVEDAQHSARLSYGFDAAEVAREALGEVGQSTQFRQRVGKVMTVWIHEVHRDAAVVVRAEEYEVRTQRLPV